MGAILLVFAGLVGTVAMPTLAAVLIYAGWGSIRPREILSVARAGTIPAIAMLATFCAVLALPVAQAVGVGVIASLLLQLNQESLDLRLVRLVRDPHGAVTETAVPTAAGPGDVVVLNVYGSLFYAGARTLQRLLPTPSATSEDATAAGTPPRGPVVVLRLRGRTTLGATFLRVVSDYARALEDADGELYLSGVDPKLVERWQRDGLTEQLAGISIFAATPVLGESTLAATAAAGVPADEGAHRVRSTTPSDSPDG
jgi:SulP family sulfate permease